jgi:hypothetical protein
MASVRPDVIVLLGATAAQSLMGNTFRLTAHRDEVLRLPAADETTDVDGRPDVVVSAHPSSVLRGPPEERAKAFDALVADLRFAAEQLRRKTWSRRCRPSLIESSGSGRTVAGLCAIRKPRRRPDRQRARRSRLSHGRGRR